MSVVINIAYPRGGGVKSMTIRRDELPNLGNQLYGHRLGQELHGSALHEDLNGYIFRIKGGCDQQGYPMVHGVLTNNRVALLLKRGATGYQKFRGRAGERRRKTVRGCIIDSHVAALNVSIIKVGDEPFEGLTDVSVPQRLGPKRANKIRKLFNLDRKSDVRKLVVRRVVARPGKQSRYKSPKIQRLITPLIRARRVKKFKEKQKALKHSQDQRRDYLLMIAKERMVARQRRAARRQRKHIAQEKRDVEVYEKAKAALQAATPPAAKTSKSAAVSSKSKAKK